VAAAGGWFWGATGRWGAERALHAIELQQDLVLGRSALLETRLAIYSVNFGEASQHLESARAALGRAHGQLAALGRTQDAAQGQEAPIGADGAPTPAGNPDQNADSPAGPARKLVADVIEAGAKAPVSK